MAKEFNDANINEVIQSGKPVVVDFWAEWCGPCKAVSPIVDELAQEFEGKVEIGKYDVDEGGDFMAEYGIRNILGDFITVRTDGGTDGSINILRPAPVDVRHLSDRHLADSGDSSLPAAVGKRNDSSHRIIKINRYAVGVGSVKDKSGHICDQAIYIRIIAVSGHTLARIRFRYNADIRSVRLLCADNAVRRHIKKARRAAEILVDIFIRIIESPAEIQGG